MTVHPMQAQLDTLKRISTTQEASGSTGSPANVDGWRASRRPSFLLQRSF
jgi:hypothetical protein